MKNLAYFLILFISFSCKNNSETEPTPNKALIGNWIWQKSTGGIGGITETPESTNKTIKLVITDHTIKISENGNPSAENDYQLEYIESIRGGIKPTLIYLPYKPAQSFEIEGNILYLMDECYDCFSYTYKRE